MFLLVRVASIVREDPFHSFDPMVKNMLQFRGVNLHQKLYDCLKKLINIIEYMTCKRYLDITKKPGGGRCQVRTVWRMRNNNEKLFIKKLF
jgi:hypothetical protein